MKKKGLLSRVAYLGISFCLLGGVIAYAGPEYTNQQTQTARVMIEDIVEGPESVIEIPEEEVPLAGAKVTTKVTTKTSTKKTTMAKAATKTAKTTSKNTKKTTKTTKSTTKKTVVETTVLTTTVTSTTKASKVKTVKTTVKTTTKTTETQLATSTSTVTTTSSFTIKSFDDMQGKIDNRVYTAFKKLGFQYICDTSISTTGVFSVKNHWIKLKINNGYYMMHELGHFVSTLKDCADSTAEWKSIYSAERANYTGSNKTYVTSTAAEYFAEAFRDYSAAPAQLQKERPRTYAYMNKIVNSIDVERDCDLFEEYYGLFW